MSVGGDRKHTTLPRVSVIALHGHVGLYVVGCWCYLCFVWLVSCPSLFELCERRERNFLREFILFEGWGFQRGEVGVCRWKAVCAWSSQGLERVLVPWITAFQLCEPPFPSVQSSQKSSVISGLCDTVSMSSSRMRAGAKNVSEFGS